MTEKDYELIARTIFYATRANNWDNTITHAITNEFIGTLKQENPRFDADKFIKRIEQYMNEWW